VIGDFNAVLLPEERRGVNADMHSTLEIVGFSRFQEELGLEDLPLLGRKFTWYHSNGVAMSRIDRGWVSSEWLEEWGDCSMWVCSRDVSDHCPLVLKYADNNWGEKPFRFNNYWLDHKNYNKVVEDCWRANPVTGWMAFVLKEKLKSLKLCLKEWHSKEFGKVDSRISKLVEDISVLDVRGESVGLSSLKVSKRKELFVDFWKLQKIKEASIFQRSRSKWLCQGDANTKFFHGCVMSRVKRNSIMALKVGDLWLDKPAQIKEAVVEFFENHFSSSNVCRPNLDEIAFPRLSLEENRTLTAPFSLEEIYGGGER
jgi:hypothetical protein